MKLLFRIRQPLAVFCAVERVAEKGRQGLSNVAIARRNGSVFVQIGAIWIHVSPRSVKLFEMQRDAEWLAGWGGGKELDGPVGDQRSKVADGAIDGLPEADRLGKAEPVVELCL